MVLENAIKELRYHCDPSGLRRLLVVRTSFPLEWESLNTNIFVPSMSSKTRADLNSTTIRFVQQLFPQELPDTCIPEFFRYMTGWLEDIARLTPTQRAELYSAFRTFLGTAKQSYKDSFEAYILKWNSLTEEEKKIITDVQVNVDPKSKKIFFSIGNLAKQLSTKKQIQFENVLLRLQNLRRNIQKIQKKSNKETTQTAVGKLILDEAAVGDHQDTSESDWSQLEDSAESEQDQAESSVRTSARYFCICFVFYL